MPDRAAADLTDMTDVLGIRGGDAFISETIQKKKKMTCKMNGNFCKINQSMKCRNKSTTNSTLKWMFNDFHQQVTKSYIKVCDVTKLGPEKGSLCVRRMCRIIGAFCFVLYEQWGQRNLGSCPHSSRRWRTSEFLQEYLRIHPGVGHIRTSLLEGSSLTLWGEQLWKTEK